jgi:homoserine kinase
VTDRKNGTRTSASVRVPATSANLGPGFDALGLALALHNQVVLSEADAVTVTISGEGAGQLPEDDGNVVVRGARAVFDEVGRPFKGVTASCVNRIPLSRGLGSSAAAWLGGLAGANALLGSPLDRPALLTLATRAEGHPDNVAAALYGGLTVAAETATGVVAVRLPTPPALRWVVLVPALTSSTAEARAVLPAQVPRGDAVFNVQRVALLLASLQTAHLDLLRHAMQDRLHEPYRLQLFPWMSAAAEAARDAGALACVLSGAGPCLLAAVVAHSEAVGAAMRRSIADAGIAATVLSLEVDTSGTVVERH